MERRGLCTVGKARASAARMSSQTYRSCGPLRPKFRIFSTGHGTTIEKFVVPGRAKPGPGTTNAEGQPLPISGHP